MQEKNEKKSYQLLVLIATPKLTDKAADMFLKSAMPIQYRLNGEGTALSEMMETLGFGGIDKGILISTVPGDFGKAMLWKLHSELKLDTVNSGIAFTVPLTGASKIVANMMDHTSQNSSEEDVRKGENAMSRTDHALIVAIVNRGFSGEVMDAARSAGAGGGTVIHSRSIGGEEAAGVWGLSAQEEKDLVLIIADIDDKVNIMKKIGETCGVTSKANGTVISLPIDAVMGI